MLRRGISFLMPSEDSDSDSQVLYNSDDQDNVSVNCML